MKGVVIFGYNNDRYDYFDMAVGCAKRVRLHTGLPVTIITDDASKQNRSCDFDIVIGQAELGGRRMFNPTYSSQTHAWLNAGRYRAWELSPYQETLVLDSDYVVASDQLLRLFETEHDVLVARDVYDPTNRDQFRNYQWIGPRMSLHHYWATVLFFRRSQLAQDFFDMMTMIRENFRHYAKIYRFPASPFRNDFAASIALNTLYGHVERSVPHMPWPMCNVATDVEVEEIADNKFELHYTVGNEKKPKHVQISQDFHCMNKDALMRIYAKDPS